MKHLIQNPTTFPLSPGEQKLAYDFTLSGESVAVDACAGSGKTYTADCVTYNCDKRVELIPFAVSLFKEQSEKFDTYEHVNVLNFHKRGRRMFGNVNVDNDKVVTLAKNLHGEEGRKVAELVTALKWEAYGIRSDVSVSDVAIKYSINPIGDDFDIEKAALEVLAESDADVKTIDCDDMLRLPILLNKRIDLGDALIILDEVQDFTPNSWEWLKACVVSPDSHVLMIGDPSRQALMGFTGASPEIFEEMAEYFNCKRVDLTVNRRCAKNIVEAAPYAGDMKPLPEAPEGEVTTMPESEVLQDICDGKYANDAVLSETNAPLIALGIKLITQDIPVQMRTEKLNKLLFRYAYKYIVNPKLKVGEMTPLLQDDLAQAAADGNDVAEFSDVVKCIDALETYCLSKGIVKSTWYRRRPCHPIQQALNALAGNTEGITLMTGHTAKGLEWNTVFHLPGKMKAPEQDWQIRQNQCLAHVIATRARLKHVTLTE